MLSLKYMIQPWPLVSFQGAFSAFTSLWQMKLGYPGQSKLYWERKNLHSQQDLRLSTLLWQEQRAQVIKADFPEA